MKNIGWLIPQFKDRTKSRADMLRLNKFAATSSDRSIQMEFSTRYRNHNMQDIIEGVLSGLPAPEAFHTFVSNISGEHRNDITVSLHAKNPQDVSKDTFQTLALMLLKHIKTNLAGEGTKTSPLQPVPTPH